MAQGCQSTGPRVAYDVASADAVIDTLRDGLESNAALPEAPAPVAPTVLRALTPEESDPDAPALTERFDLSVNQVPSHEFFRSLVKGTPFTSLCTRTLTGLFRSISRTCPWTT